MRPRVIVVAVGIMFVANLGYWFVRHRAIKTETEGKKADQAITSHGHHATQLVRFAVTADEAPTQGVLRLEGQVVDASGLPVAAAKIVLADAGGREADSEVDGSFAFDGLAARRYTLFAYAASGVAGPATVQLDAKTDPVVLRLHAAASLTVRVREARSKQPVKGATVEVRGPVVRAATTDGEGLARIANIAPGDVEVMARAPGFARQFGFAHLSAGQGASIVPMELLLVAGAPVSGVVQAADGKAVAGAQVSYQAVSAIMPVDIRRDGVMSDAGGRFQLDALPAGTFRIVASHPPEAPGASELLTLDGTTARTDVVVKLLEGVTVKGVVVTSEGAPVVGAEVRLVNVSVGGSAGAGARQTQSDANGQFILHGVARGRVALSARHERGASDVVEIDTSGAAAAEAKLIIGRTATISGRVVDSAGEPIEAALVALNPDRARATKMSSSEWLLAGAREEVSDGAGNFEIGGLVPGRYELRASRAGASAGGPGRERLSEPTFAEAGARGVVLVVPAAARLTGRVVRKGAAPPAFTVALGARAPIPFASNDGVFSLDDLPPVRVDVTIRGLGFMPKTISAVKLSAGETTDLGTIEVEPGRTISGRVMAGSNPVAGATVRAGRMLFGDGSSQKGALFAGLGGENTRESETDERGEFMLVGVGASKLFVSAEQVERGRSQPFELPPGDESVSGIVLSLDGFGVLAGRVVKAGAPVESVLVNARPLAASGVFYGGQSGADGKFRFDKLAPGSYKVSSTKASLSGMSFQAVAATVVSGKTTEVELDLGGGDLSLRVAIVPSGGTIAFATVALCEGTIAPNTAAELTTAMAAIGQGYSAMGMSFKGSPAEFKQLAPARYTACAIAYPPSIGDFNEARLYAEKNEGKQAVTCVPVQLAAGSSDSRVEIHVAAPPELPSL
jgi:protocatechuate 3,4-dioxygenase beta subunit